MGLPLARLMRRSGPHDNRPNHARRNHRVFRRNHPAGDVDRAGYQEDEQVTTTAHEDQFTVAPTPPISKEAEAIAAWLDRHGYREIAARIRAGEHLA